MKKNILVIIVAAAIVAAGTVFCVLMMNKMKKDEEAAAASAAESLSLEREQSPVKDIFATMKNRDETSETDAAPTTAPTTSTTTAPALTAPTTAATTVHQKPTGVVKTTKAPDTTTAPTSAPETEPTTEKETTTQTTTKKETTTSAPAKTSSNLKNVTSTLNGGSYTLKAGVTEDEADKMVKVKSGSNTAYMMSMPNEKFECRVINKDGKYYLVANSMYTELSDDQYKKLKNDFESSLGYDFGGLSYQNNEIKMDNSGLYTKEVYKDKNGKTINLWFKSGDLAYVEPEGSQSKISFEVKNGADESILNIPDTYKQVEYSQLEPFTVIIDALEVK